MLVLPALLRSIGLHGKEEDKIHRVSNCDAINQELRHVVDWLDAAIQIYAARLDHIYSYRCVILCTIYAYLHHRISNFLFM